MRSVWTLPFTIAAMLAITDYDAAHAVPVNPQPLSAAAPASDIQLAQEAVRGPRGGEAVRGPRGGEAVRGPRGGAAVRGPQGGVAVRGPHGGVAVGGPRGGYRVGQHYHGGVWHGTGRHYWRGRWWPYGVGDCWRPSPIGFVWICG